MKCILCSNKSFLLIDKLKFDDLSYLYSKKGISINHLKSCNIIYFYECNVCKLRFFYPLIVSDEFFYNQLQEFNWYYLDYKEEYKYAGRFIHKNAKLLEVGAGKGAFAKFLKIKNYVGLEYSKNAIDIAKLNNIQILNDSIENFASKNVGNFDIVCSFQVLEHVPDPYIFLQSKVQALKIGGILIIAIPSEEGFLRYATNDILNLPPHHLTRWKDCTLQVIARIFNLDLLEIFHEKVSAFHHNWFTNILLQNSFLRYKMVDLSYKRLFVSKISSILARILLSNQHPEMLLNGHTVTAVYKKI